MSMLNLFSKPEIENKSHVMCASSTTENSSLTIKYDLRCYLDDWTNMIKLKGEMSYKVCPEIYWL